MWLYQIIYYTWKNIKQSYKNNKFKISVATWNGELELPDRSIIFYIRYSRLFSIYIKKTWENIVNTSIRTYVNKIENRITFKIKTWYYLKLLIAETMKLLGRTKSNITENKIGENIPHLESTEIVLVNCNIVNNNCPQN